MTIRKREEWKGKMYEGRVVEGNDMENDKQSLETRERKKRRSGRGTEIIDVRKIGERRGKNNKERGK